MLIAIDGPAASGKGTIAKELAEHFGYAHIDSGLFYRLYPDIVAALSAIPEAERPEFIVNQILTHDLDSLRNEAHAKSAAKFAQEPDVRRIVTEAVRLFAKKQELELGGVVADGRDVATNIFPDATVKIYVTAELGIRSERRFNELKSRGLEVDLQSVASDIRARDERDSGRSAAPLRQADDADLLDTTDMTIGAAVQRAISLVEARIRR